MSAKYTLALMAVHVREGSLRLFYVLKLLVFTFLCFVTTDGKGSIICLYLKLLGNRGYQTVLLFKSQLHILLPWMAVLSFGQSRL